MIEEKRYYGDLEEGAVRLVNSIRMVGDFVKWLFVGILGTALGTVMFGLSLAKIMGWMRG